MSGPADIADVLLCEELQPLAAWLHAREAIATSPERHKLHRLQRLLAFQDETSAPWVELTIERRHHLPAGEMGVRSSWLYVRTNGRALELGGGEHEVDPLGDPDGWRSSWVTYERFDDGSQGGDLNEWFGALQRYDPPASAVDFALR